VRAHFNSALFTKGDSTQPELAGLLGAVVGSALMLMVTALIAIPVGVGALIGLGRAEWTELHRTTTGVRSAGAAGWRRRS
jgi:ABC-type phosphate transport system permease subunit